jgi:transcriptional regulator with XRE-family HTH domain
VGRLPKAEAAARSAGKRRPRGGPDAETLGDRIRNLRRERGLRLVDMAKLTDLSVSFISQVERGLTNPGMRSLILMADALEVRPHALLEDAPPCDELFVLTRADEQAEVPNDGGTARTITSNANPRFNAFDFSGGPRQFYTWYRSKGDVLIIVLAGQLEVEVETHALTMATGDTLYVRAGTNHRWRQVGRARCRVLTVLHSPQWDESGPQLEESSVQPGQPA